MRVGPGRSNTAEVCSYITCEKLPMLRVVAMPVDVVGAGKVPEAALRFLLAAVHAIEFIAQPGQVRVLAWMSNAVRGAGCARGGSSGRGAAHASPQGLVIYIRV